MKIPTISRTTFALLSIAALIVSAEGMSLHRRSGEEPSLGSQSAEFYQKGTQNINRQYNGSLWKSFIEKGFVPYHQLVESDFRIDDQVDSQSKVYTMGFIRYRFTYNWVVVDRKTMRATIAKMDILSGFDRTQSWRHSDMNDPSVYLQHEQGHLNISELAAKTFAARVTEARPEGLGDSQETALKDLNEKVKAIYTKVEDANRKSQQDYDSKTRCGLDREAQSRVYQAQQGLLKQAGIQPTWTAKDEQTVSHGVTL